MEVFNETCTLIATYGLIVFTPFVPHPEARYEFGWALIGVTILILIANVLVMCYTTIREICWKAKLRRHKHHVRKIVKTR